MQDLRGDHINMPEYESFIDKTISQKKKKKTLAFSLYKASPIIRYSINVKMQLVVCKDVLTCKQINQYCF